MMNTDLAPLNLDRIEGLAKQAGPTILALVAMARRTLAAKAEVERLPEVLAEIAIGGWMHRLIPIRRAQAALDTQGDHHAHD